VKVLQRYTNLHTLRAILRILGGPPINHSTKKKVIESQMVKYFWRRPTNCKKPKTYYSAIQSPDKVLRLYIQSPDKVLQRYTKPRQSTTALYKAQTKYYSAIQSIVVYLKSPRRRREKANVLQRYRITYPRIRAFSLVRGECATALQDHVPKNPGI